MSAPVSVLIPTFNEEPNIAQCLSSVLGWADEVFVVDSFSTDRTVAIAKEMGANVIQHKFEGYAEQKNWAMDTLPFRNEWLLILDADEYVTEDSRQEMAMIAAADGSGYDGYHINRRFIFYGKWIKHCGWYPSWHLRFFRHKLGRYENRPVDEHVILNGRAGHLKHDLMHRDCRDMTWWIAKHNRYATLNAIAYEQIQNKQHADERIRPRFFGNQVERRRFVKERIWRYLPFRSLLFFTYLYIFRWGFLDGRKGFVFCSMHGIFEQMKVVKQWELKEIQNLQPLITNQWNVKQAEAASSGVGMSAGAERETR
jgi:glycosyltransferase involved in cell wall biosynthesis